MSSVNGAGSRTRLRSMKSEAEIRIFFENEEQANAAVAAIKHEEDFKKRSDSKVIRGKKTLTIKIDALDLVALRATLNSYLRDIQIIENVEKTED